MRFSFGFVSCHFSHKRFFFSECYRFKKCIDEQHSQYLLWRLHRKIESSALNKYGSTCRVWWCACSPWGTGLLHSKFLGCVPTRVIVFLLCVTPFQVLILDNQTPKMKVLNCENNFNSPCCYISNKL